MTRKTVARRKNYLRVILSKYAQGLSDYESLVSCPRFGFVIAKYGSPRLVVLELRAELRCQCLSDGRIDRMLRAVEFATWPPELMFGHQPDYPVRT